ncbi:MAG: 1-acyl-sn-glycerol-3-phosphate acyltransferase [Campylobacteraceae bacterium]|jgi:1-acyl-sn-glycerol-3-phosphate acyltransferase|nr:1-acyl-sn-glycerol-3-phosphate acyltransferase [Campylobacteraceae bacterium]
MLQKIRAVFVAATFIFTISVVIIIMFFYRKKNRAVRKKWAILQQFIVGFKLKAKGSFDDQARLFVINHQSILDIVVIEALFEKDKDIAWVSKKEIFDMPFLGQSVRLSKMIRIDRGDKRAIVKLLKDAKDRVDNNRLIAIFPEGTRGEGEKLLKFQIGAKILAEKLGLIVQPIVIANARNVFDSQNFKVKSGTVVVSYLPSVNPKADENWYEKLHSDMQDELTKLLEDNEIY